jgi:hypothetical protein
VSTVREEESGSKEEDDLTYGPRMSVSVGGRRTISVSPGMGRGLVPGLGQIRSRSLLLFLFCFLFLLSFIIFANQLQKASNQN